MNIIGHRGARGLAAENTIQSIELARSLGVNEVEIDVHVTSDNLPVLWHDSHLPHLGSIRHHRLTELQGAKPDLATFEQVLSLDWTQTSLRIEIKPRVNVAPIFDLIDTALRRGLRLEQVAVASFDMHILRSVRERFPNIRLIVNEEWSGVRATWRARRLGTQHLCFNRRALWFGFISSMHQRGYIVSTFTLNDPQKARAWSRWGLDGVVTDFPDRFIEKP